MSINTYRSSFLISLILIFISACSSSESSSDTTNGASVTPAVALKNVSAASNGGSATSTFSGNESFTIDGDIAPINFWKGGSSGDEVKVGFDKSYTVSELTIQTNNISISSTSGVTISGIRVFLSADDISYSEVGVSLGSSLPISCSGIIIGSGQISCTLASTFNAAFIKVSVTSDFAVTEIYEIEVMGN